MANPKIEVELGAGISEFQRKLNTALANLKNFGDQASQKIKKFGDDLVDAEGKIQKFGQTSKRVGTVLSAAITLPILAIGAASLKAASDAEETFSKFDIVFRDVQKSAEDSFKTLRNEYGLSALASKELLSNTGDLLTGFGFSQEAALDLSTQVAKLGVDLASFTNFSGGAKGATDALTKALLGERESVKALGISILEEDVKKQVAINSAKGLTFETERQAKAYATLDIALSQSKNALGDYARTSDGFANQQKLLSARIEDLTVSIGSVFIPVANKLVGIAISIVDGLNSIDAETRKVIIVITGIAAAIGPLLLVIGSLISAFPLIVTGFAAVKAAVIAATGPFGLIALAVAAAIPFLIDLNSELNKTKNIAGEVKADLLAESLKASREEFDRLSASLEKGGLTKLEAQNRAIDLLLKQELELLKARDTNKDIDFDAIKARVTALNELKETINKVTVSTALSAEELNKLADIKNEEVFRMWTAEADKFNDSISETIRLQKSIADVSQSIVSSDSERNINPVSGIMEISIPPINTDEFDDSVTAANQKIIEANSLFVESARNMKDQFLNAISDITFNTLVDSITESFFALGEAMAQGTNGFKAFGGALLNTIGSFLKQLGKEMVAYGVAALAMAVLTQALTNPITAIPAAIGLIAAGAALSLAAGAIQGSLKGKGSSGGGGGGGGSVGAGVGSQAYTGSGLERSMNFEFVPLKIQGSDIYYSLEQQSKKRNQG